MVYIYTDNVQNEITFYFDNKIYRLSNSENNDGIETVKFSAYFKHKPKNKNLKIQFVFFLNAPFYYIRQNTEKEKRPCNPTETTNRISLIRLYGVTPPNPELGGRGSPSYTQSTNAHRLVVWLTAQLFLSFLTRVVLRESRVRRGSFFIDTRTRTSSSLPSLREDCGFPSSVLSFASSSSRSTRNSLDSRRSCPTKK